MYYIKGSGRWEDEIQKKYPKKTKKGKTMHIGCG